MAFRREARTGSTAIEYARLSHSEKNITARVLKVRGVCLYNNRTEAEKAAIAAAEGKDIKDIPDFYATPEKAGFEVEFGCEFYNERKELVTEASSFRTNCTYVDYITGKVGPSTRKLGELCTIFHLTDAERAALFKLVDTEFDNNYGRLADQVDKSTSDGGAVIDLNADGEPNYDNRAALGIMVQLISPECCNKIAKILMYREDGTPRAVKVNIKAIKNGKDDEGKDVFRYEIQPQ